jgi:hypothetical protein
MPNYNIKYTNNTKEPISVNETEVNSHSLDIDLFGRINLEYGENLNQDLLNILENFSCPEDSSVTDEENAFPDLDSNRYRFKSSRIARNATE